MNDTKGIEIKRMDFVENTKGYVFLVTKSDDGLYLWDFQAWCQGYYDAYIPLKEVTETLKIIGNFWNRMRKIETLEDLLEYATANGWALKAKTDSPHMYFFITPQGNHVSVGIRNNGRLSSWSDFPNP